LGKKIQLTKEDVYQNHFISFGERILILAEGSHIITQQSLFPPALPFCGLSRRLQKSPPVLVIQKIARAYSDFDGLGMKKFQCVNV
jgi:hypothetical protein